MTFDRPPASRVGRAVSEQQNDVNRDGEDPIENPPRLPSNWWPSPNIGTVLLLIAWLLVGIRELKRLDVMRSL